MPDNRDMLAQMISAGQTGGMTPGDFTTFANKLNDPTALQAWGNAGGVFGQQGLKPPDPDEQYFANRGPMSGSATDTGWMNAIQPEQGGASGATGASGGGFNRTGSVGGGGMARADPAYWGWQGPHQGYARGSTGDLSGFNAGRGPANVGNVGRNALVGGRLNAALNYYNRHPESLPGVPRRF